MSPGLRCRCACGSEARRARLPVEIVDRRGLQAFTFSRDMEGRTLNVRSVDAGETRNLPDALDRTIAALEQTEPPGAAT